MKTKKTFYEKYYFATEERDYILKVLETLLLKNQPLEGFRLKKMYSTVQKLNTKINNFRSKIMSNLEKEAEEEIEAEFGEAETMSGKPPVYPLEVISEAYASILSIKDNVWRVKNNALFCCLCDYIARETGKTSQEVRERYEQTLNIRREAE